MHIQKITNRSIQFTETVQSSWNLNFQLILGDVHNFLIDTGLGSFHMEQVIAFLERDTKPLYLINTHYHWDHIYGNSSFPNSPILAHRLCHELILEKWDAMMEQNHSLVEGTCEKRLPTILFEQEIYFPEDGVRIFYSPGHTLDSVSILDEKDKILYAGDNIGDTLEELIPQRYCEESLLEKTLHVYHSMDIQWILSGHNKPLPKETISTMLSLLSHPS